MTRFIYFVTSNLMKLQEVSDVIATRKDLRIEFYELKLQERLCPNLIELLEDKVIAAFQHVRQPVIVDHTSLYIEALGGLPGIASSLLGKGGSEAICRAMRPGMTQRADMRVGMAYTDGIVIHCALDTRRGTIVSSPRGARQFDWDSIFAPDGGRKTFAEMSIDEKNSKSPRSRAFIKLLRKLQK